METGIAVELGKIATNITGTVADVAPVALGVVGVFMAWKYGMRFFKGLSK